MVTAPGGVRAAPARDQLDLFIKKFVCVCVCVCVRAYMRVWCVLSMYICLSAFTLQHHIHNVTVDVDHWMFSLSLIC